MTCGSHHRSTWHTVFAYVIITQILLSQQGNANCCDYDVSDYGSYCGENVCHHHKHSLCNCVPNDCHHHNRLIYRRDPVCSPCAHPSHLHPHYCHPHYPYPSYYPNYSYNDYYNNCCPYNPDYFLRGLVPGCNPPCKPKTKVKLSVVETLEYPSCEKNTHCCKEIKECCKIVPECRLEEFITDHNLEDGEYRICPCPKWKVPRYYCVKYFKKCKGDKSKHKKNKGRKSYLKKATDALIKPKSKDNSCDSC